MFIAAAAAATYKLHFFRKLLLNVNVAETKERKEEREGRKGCFFPNKTTKKRLCVGTKNAKKLLCKSGNERFISVANSDSVLANIIWTIEFVIFEIIKL